MERLVVFTKNWRKRNNFDLFSIHFELKNIVSEIILWYSLYFYSQDVSKNAMHKIIFYRFLFVENLIYLAECISESPSSAAVWRSCEQEEKK